MKQWMKMPVCRLRQLALARGLMVLLVVMGGWVMAHAVGANGQYRWSVQLRGYVSAETGKEPTAHLWLPTGIDTVRAVVMAQQNMTEEALFKMPAFKERMARLGIGLLWIAPAFTNTWDPLSGCQQVFEELMTDIAYQSGHPELATAPVIPFGHSAQATFPWNFAAWNKARTLCIISFHGDAPRTNLCGFGASNVEWGRTRNIDGVPGLMVEGEYEWWEARVYPALAFRMMYPESCVSFLCDTGRGHFDCSEETALYIADFIDKSMQHRYRGVGQPLASVNVRQGWLAERWHPGQQERPAAAPYDSYRGDRHDAFWYFDQEMAQRTEQRYARDARLGMQYVGVEYGGEQVSYDEKTQGGMMLHIDPTRLKQQNGYPVFSIRAVAVDAQHRKITPGKAWRGTVETICGPVEKIGEDLFRIVPYEGGLDNPRRSFTIWLCAVAQADDASKTAVQPIQIRLK